LTLWLKGRTYISTSQQEGKSGSLSSPSPTKTTKKMSTYRFDKKGKRILDTEKKKRSPSHLVQTPDQADDVSGERTALQRLTSERIKAANAGKSSKPLAKKAPDADLHKPLRHIAIAFGVVITIAMTASFVTTFSESHQNKAAEQVAVTQINHSKLSHWSKADARKHLLAAAKKAEGLGNYKAAAAIFATLADEPGSHQTLAMALADPKTSPAALAAGYDKLARAVGARGRTAEADELFAKAIAADPSNLEYSSHLAHFYLQTDRLDKAQVLNEKHKLQVALGSPATLARYHDLKGRIAARSGQDQLALNDLQTAVGIFERMKVKDSDYADTLRELAWVELRTGHRASAAQLFDRVIAATTAAENRVEKYVLRQINN